MANIDPSTNEYMQWLRGTTEVLNSKTHPLPALFPHSPFIPQSTLSTHPQTHSSSSYSSPITQYQLYRRSSSPPSPHQRIAIAPPLILPSVPAPAPPLPPPPDRPTPVMTILGGTPHRINGGALSTRPPWKLWCKFNCSNCCWFSTNCTVAGDATDDSSSSCSTSSMEG